MEVVKLSPDEWRGVAEDTHLVVFSEKRPASLDRIDYALLACADAPLGYITVRETDAESVYWQYGGGFPSSREKIWALRAYQACISWTKAQGYKRINTLIKNDNVRYLKMAMSQGFRVIGVRMHGGSVLCELLLEFEEEK